MKNIALSARLKKSLSNEGLATWEGTVTKTVAMMIVLLISSVLGYGYGQYHPLVALALSVVFCLLIIAIGIFIIRNATRAERYGPVYVIIEGLLLGFLASAIPLKGIVAAAVFTTLIAVIVCTIAWKKKWIKVTDRFRSITYCAIEAVLAVYIIDILIVLFGGNSFICGHGFMSTIITLVVCTVAAVSLIVDFQDIEDEINKGLPVYYEWYFGFSIIVTVVWMYLQILQFLINIVADADIDA